MDELKKIITGAVITIAIGGGAYTVSQTDIINNFAQDSGMSQQQAEEYVNNLGEDDLDSWTNIGNSFVEDGEVVLDYAAEIDCSVGGYWWQSATLSCDQGKSQLQEFGSDEYNLGKAYIKLDDDNAGKNEMSDAINKIDKLNQSIDYEIIGQLLEEADIQDGKNTNYYNKSILKTALESEK